MSPLSFDNTEIAFAHQSDAALSRSRWLFSLMGKSALVQLGSRFTPWAIRIGLPIKGLIRGTIFKQFVGGETLEQTIPVARHLGEYGVDVILDYGVEGTEGEESYDHATEEFIRVIRFAATQPNVPFMSIKVTGLGRFGLLEKMDELMHAADGSSLMDNFQKAMMKLSAAELNEWSRVVARMQKICEAARDSRIGFLVDAEESWIQDPVDAITMKMMDEYNRGTVVVYNTIQLYRHDRLAFLKKCHAASSGRGFTLAVKLVRGAYMEKERKRAAEKGYASPIQPDKASTDRDYDDAVRFCIEHIDNIHTIVASHNEGSNLLAASLLTEKGLSSDDKRLQFSQLYGMSDNITFNLAKSGFNVSKYLPFGPIKDVIPYLMRRAQENTSVGGQTGRELVLINKERLRRKHK